MNDRAIKGFESATLAFVNFKKAIDTVSDQLNLSTEAYVQVSNRLREMSAAKNEELDRILYLREIQNYTGYRPIVFADIKNVKD